MTRRNPWTARERGLMVGYEWAKHYKGDPFDLKPAAEGDIDERTEAAISELLGEIGDLGDLDHPRAFWGGFSHGVSAFLVEQGITIASTRTDEEQG